eukprot:6631899-Prymnesium_polylepis.1
MQSVLPRTPHTRPRNPQCTSAASARRKRAAHSMRAEDDHETDGVKAQPTARKSSIPSLVREL